MITALKILIAFAGAISICALVIIAVAWLMADNPENKR